jgi:hypothetical protein
LICCRYPDHPGGTGAPAKTRRAQEYVALCDSFTAGPLIPLQIQPFGCLEDVPYLRAKQKELNAMLADQAAA